jgi:hypothetical protein
MSLGSALRELGGFLDACRADGTVSSVELSGDGEGTASRVLTAEVVLTATPVRDDGDAATLSLADATVAADGTLRLGFESTSPVLPTAEYDVEVDSTVATVDGDGTVTVEAVVSVPTGETGATETAERTAATVAAAGGETAAEAPDDGMAETDETGVTGDGDADEGSSAEGEGPLASRDRDIPPFRDRELLAEVYESCDTFAEMTEALGMDVTAETVRRYMVDHGIHEPNSYDTGGSDGSEPDEAASGAETATTEGTVDPNPEPEPESEPDPTPAVVADGIGLPDDVTVETLIETVKRSNTIYEVRRDIGIEHDDALEMLRELNLLDLVVGRLATEAERDISHDEIVDRLRRASATQ